MKTWPSIKETIRPVQSLSQNRRKRRSVGQSGSFCISGAV